MARKAVFYQGSKAELQDETRRLPAEAGVKAFFWELTVTVPDDLILERLTDWQAAVFKGEL